MKQKFVLVLFGFLFSFSLAAAPPALPKICGSLNKSMQARSVSRRFQQFLDLQWNHNMTEYPEWATRVGFKGQDDRWTDMSLEAIGRRRLEDQCMLEILRKLPSGQLKGEERISYDLAKDRLERSIDGAQFGSEYLVLDHLEGLHSEIADILAVMPAVTKRDFENMLARLSAVPHLKTQVETLLREGLKRKITPVKIFLLRVPAQFDQVLTPRVEDSPLYRPFRDISSASLSEIEKKDLQARAKSTIEATVYPSLKKLRAFLESEYIPNARESISFSDMPNGKAWYAYRVRQFTTTEMNAEELHALGVAEVARLTKEMIGVKERVKFKGDLKAFNRFLLTDKQFYYTKKEDLLVGYRDIAKRLDPELPKLFKTLPRLPYGVREVPEYKAKASSAAYYEGGSLESGRAGYFYANTSDLASRPKWGMEALTIHEAVPGHHFQIALSREIQDLPDFRRNRGYSAYSEGWALYAESLGEDMGFYKDPYSKYGQLSYEMWRAIRLVLDTGIHSKGWTRDQAIEYFQANMAKSRTEAEVEVDRYITWPGQALSYKVGQLRIRQMRDRAEARLKDRFDVREFHDEVLKHGALPMNVLEKTMEEWLKAASASRR